MNRRQALLTLAALALAPAARAGGLDAIALGDAAQALKDSLNQAAKAALERLGKPDGFLANPKVKIGLHKNLAKAEKLLRGMGHGPKLDDLVRSMNRAAEQSMGKLEPLVRKAVQDMKVEDAKAILSGGEGAVTAWFRKATEAGLTAEMLPVIHQAADKSDLVRAYNNLSKTLARWNIKGELATVEEYVARKALDGFYALAAETEADLRAHPAKYATEAIQKVFGALLK